MRAMSGFLGVGRGAEPCPDLSWMRGGFGGGYDPPW